MNKLLFALIGLAAFLTFMIAMVPAAPIYSAFEEELAHNLPDITLSDVGGSIWNGRGEISYRQFPPGNINWQLSPVQALTGTAAIDIQLNGTGLEADIVGALTADGGRLSKLTASVSADYLNQVTLNYGLDLSGEVQLPKASLTFNKSWLTSAEGDLRWTGGIVHIETPERIHTVKLPAFDGQVSMIGDTLELHITQTGTRMMEISLTPDGWAKVAIDYALIDLVDLPLPGSRDTSEPAVIMEEKIF
ncbi:MAG: type II secretion system protein N [Gammaproteobacteria bacterium]|jgi:hypothetical protein|nr:type II secretion system protein N [Gammaproteobacteria bacterium]MBT4494000.1 type II secretion system protein N [Gammaproteobacteria bacterium]MBT7372238.1 type II secretion system protein N [Gammaproteobacteria bacterium]